MAEEMKERNRRIQKILAAGALCAACTLSSCKKEEDVPVDTSQAQQVQDDVMTDVTAEDGVIPEEKPDGENTVKESFGEETDTQELSGESADGDVEILDLDLLAAQQGAEIMEENASNALTASAAKETANERSAVDAASLLMGERVYGIHFLNATGKDLISLKVTLNTGDHNNVEAITGEEKFRDGDAFLYTNSTIAGYSNLENLTLTVSAQATDGSEMTFETIRLYDLAGSYVMLDASKDGYGMYLCYD